MTDGPGVINKSRPEDSDTVIISVQLLGLVLNSDGKLFQIVTVGWVLNES